jgi:phage-related baseplate assembly protein
LSKQARTRSTSAPEQLGIFGEMGAYHSVSQRGEAHAQEVAAEAPTTGASADGPPHPRSYVSFNSRLVANIS